MLQSKSRSKDLKTQKMHICILKATGLISKVTSLLIDLKNRKNLSPTNLKYSTGPIVHGYTISLTLISHVNRSLKQNHRHHIA